MSARQTCITCQLATATLRKRTNHAQVYCTRECYYIGLPNPVTGVEDDDMVGLESSEGRQFTLTRAEVAPLLTIAGLVEDAGAKQYIPLPNVDGATLQAIIRRLQNKDADVVTGASAEQLIRLVMATIYLDYAALTDELLPHIGAALLSIDDALTRAALTTLKDYYPTVLVHLERNQLNAMANMLIRVYGSEAAERHSLYIMLSEIFITHSLLKWALIRKHGAAAKSLLQSPRFDADSPYHYGVIEDAASMGSIELVELLLKTLRNEVFTDATSAAAVALHNNRADILLKVVSYMVLDSGTLLYSPYWPNQIVRFAVAEGHLEVLELALKFECYRGMSSRQIKEWLELAVRNNQIEIFKFFLQHYEGLDELVDFDPSVVIAIKKGYNQLLAVLLAYPMVNDQLNANYTLRIAVNAGNLFAVEQLLLSPSFDANQIDALHLAITTGRADIVAMLLQDGRMVPTEETRELAEAHGMTDVLAESTSSKKQRIRARVECQYPQQGPLSASARAGSAKKNP